MDATVWRHNALIANFNTNKQIEYSDNERSNKRSDWRLSRNSTFPRLDILSFN